jgi:glycerol-3-phosphate cytidylyltransferase-like family protein
VETGAEDVSLGGSSQSNCDLEVVAKVEVDVYVSGDGGTDESDDSVEKFLENIGGFIEE